MKNKTNIIQQDIKKIYNSEGKVYFFTYNIDGVIFHFTRDVVKDKEMILYDVWTVGTNNQDIPVVKFTPKIKDMSLTQVVYAGLSAVKEELFNRIDMDQNSYRKISEVLGEYSIYGENHK